jgi:threonine synthase
MSLLFKDETRNPSGSFKDRAAALIVSEAVERGAGGVVLTSSGNAAAALAMYCAIAGIACRIYASPLACREKLLQARAFGAVVAQPVDASESALASTVSSIADEPGWSDASTIAAKSPLTVEGYKTIAYEIAAVMHPTAIIAPVGAGTLLLGLWKGFRELRDWGLTPCVPRLIGVQPEGWDPVSIAFERGAQEIAPRFGGQTIAHGVALGDPGPDGRAALRAIRETGGAVLSVDDEAVRTAQDRLARCEGVLTEPSGAVAVAGAWSARKANVIDEHDTVVAIITGHGLKDGAGLSALVDSVPIDAPRRGRSHGPRD